ncbi:hypothetical protein GCK72_022320 [Caenorhabditis remanei]|uniref:F-box domain-containing protein n=1 Tax=Caenorhabditis remanei TaxID=31234 RepID=A0A6A5FTK0_CAERE|nr:hypothetical protein GCK72_022320 [Caenorhabditis remanei]KAF1745873.1 hypothetical protein GCK72_022320 [Caenorhabditis remanei]
MDKLAEAQKQLSRKRVFPSSSMCSSQYSNSSSSSPSPKATENSGGLMPLGQSVFRTAHHLPGVWVTEGQDDMKRTCQLAWILWDPKSIRMTSAPTWNGMPDRVKLNIFQFLNTLEKSRLRQVTRNDKRVMDSIPQKCAVVAIQVSDPWMSCKVIENRTTPEYEIKPDNLTFDMSSVFKNPRLVIGVLDVSVFLSGFGRLKKLISSFQFWGLPKNSLKVENLRLHSEAPDCEVFISDMPYIEGLDTFKYFVALLTYLDVRVLKKITIHSFMAIDLLQRLGDTQQWKTCNWIEIRTKELFHYNQLFNEWRGTKIEIWGLNEKSLITEKANSYVKPYLEKRLGSTYHIRSVNEEVKSESQNHHIPTVLGANILHVTLHEGYLKGVVEPAASSSQAGASSSNC